MNPFLKPIDNYNRDYDIRKAAVRQIAKYISVKLNKSMDDAIAFVVKEMRDPTSKFAFKDPEMKRLRKVARGTREEEVTSFISYIEEANEQGHIISPSLVTYLPANEHKSVTAVWLDANIENRRRAKNRMFVLKQAGDAAGSQRADYDQNARKIRINTVSGMRGFKGNPLYLSTGHSTLTSTCRSAAGYGNATVERFISGARHYYSPEIVKANILSVIDVKDRAGYERVIATYGLVYPTVEQSMQVVRSSSDMYFNIPDSLKEIEELLTSISPLERALFCYSGDFYHIAQFNDTFARTFAKAMIVGEIDETLVVDTADVLKTMSKTEVVYINSLCADILKGSTHEDVAKNDTKGWQHIGRVAQKVKETLQEYSEFIGYFFAVDHLPPTVANIRSIQRKAALTADTDSAIFTTQLWIEWYTGTLKRTTDGDKMWYLITYMGCQCIAHSLAMLSANIGVERNAIFRLSMKNEYAFPQFAITSAAKHYYCNMSMREGNVFSQLELDVKGVGLRGSDLPKDTLDAAEAMMTDILQKANDCEQFKASEILDYIASREQRTVNSVLMGDLEFLKTSSIKPDTVNMIHHDFWQYVLGPKYGRAIEPPYPTVSVNTTLVNRTAIVEFTKSLEKTDPAMAQRFVDWITSHNRKDFKSMRLPTLSVQDTGIPDELREIIDYRKITYQVNKPFYTLLESLGLNIVDRDHMVLVTDYLGKEFKIHDIGTPNVQ